MTHSLARSALSLRTRSTLYLVCRSSLRCSCRCLCLLPLPLPLPLPVWSTSIRSGSFVSWLKPLPLENVEDESSLPAVLEDPMGESTAGARGKTKRGDELSGRYLPEHDVKKGSMVLVLSLRSIDYVSTKFVLNCFFRITWRRPEQDVKLFTVLCVSPCRGEIRTSS